MGHESEMMDKVNRKDLYSVFCEKENLTRSFFLCLNLNISLIFCTLLYREV